jgi:hypothetical protein
MNSRHALLCATLAVLPLVTPLAAQAPTDAIRIEVAGVARVLSGAELRRLVQDTVRARAHDGPEQVFVGPTLARVLTTGGAQLDSLRGRGLAQYVVVEARDAYRVIFAVAELSSAFTHRRIILAHSVDGRPLEPVDGPWQVIVEDELRPARWVRQVTTIRVLVVPD